MFRIPHWVLLICIFGLWIRLKHLFEFSCSVIGLSDCHTDEIFDFDDNVILFDIIFKGVFLEYLIIGSFGGFTELASTIHPSPEVFGGGDNVIGNVIERFDQLSGWRSGSKVGMFIVSFNLEKGVAFTCGGVNWLVNEGFERKKGSQSHFENSVVNSPFPVIIILLHHHWTLSRCPQNKLLNVLQKLVPNYLVFLWQLIYCPLHMFVTVSWKLRRVERTLFSTLKIKLLQYHCFLNTSNNVLNHSWWFTHFLLYVDKCLYCSPTVLNKIINPQTWQILWLMALLYDLIQFLNLILQ